MRIPIILINKNNNILALYTHLFGIRVKDLQGEVISLEIKKQLYTTLICPVVTCGAETWILRNNEERKLMVLERKILKKI